MLDRDTGAVIEKMLVQEGETVRTFYASIPPPVVVGIEATGSMGWFLRLMEELAIECRVGHPVAIRRAESRRQKHDRRDAALLLQLLAEDRFPTIWMPSTELRDLRALLLHRHPMGSDAHARAERVARDRDGARGAARPHAVESRRPGAARRVARQLGRRKRNPDPQLVRRIDVDLFISSSYRLNESQFRLAGHLRGCDFAQNEKYLDVRGRTAFSSLPMDQLMLWEVGFQFLKDSGGKAAGANEKRDLHWNPLAHRVLSQDAPPSSP